MYERVILTLTAWTCLFAGYVPSFFAALYHQFGESSVEALIASCFAAGLMVTPVLIAALLLDIKIVRCLAYICFTYGLYKLIRVNVVIEPLNFHSKFFLILSFLFISVPVCYLSRFSWLRVSCFLCGGLAFFVLSTPIIALIQKSNDSIKSLSVENIIGSSNIPTLVLILDEMSVEAAVKLKSVLINDGHIIHFKTIQKAGENTVNAIPSMLVANRHDHISECGTTQLCGKVPFDMSSLKSSRADVDIVGFYHPYCSINGLRSCYMATINGLDDHADIFNLMLERLPIFGQFVNTDKKAKLTDSKFRYFRDSIVEHSLKAPFWSDGGVLFIHQILPHPSGSGLYESLEKEYGKNMDEASNFVSKLNELLRLNFGKNYALLITTDHSLRLRMWCSNPAYSGQGCSLDNVSEELKIPFLAFVPNAVEVRIPESSVGLFFHVKR
jgi:hypothetical protein